MPLITVFTPTFNRAHTLPRTYESLCSQDCRDFCWLVIDDGSTDNTRSLVEGWMAENRIPIRYIYKENGGLYTGYNVAYENIDTELCVCVDSDDFMPDDAIGIICHEWGRCTDKNAYAGLIGLDFDVRTGMPIGGFFPEELRECFFLDLYTKKIHIGDTKPVMRTELMRAAGPQVGFPGEKNFNPVYLMLKVFDDLPLLVVNRNLCNVEYQVGDSMSQGIFKQYFNSPRSFSKMRCLEMQLKRSNWRNRVRVCVHYVATSIIARNRRYICQSPRPFLTILCTPAGLLLYLFLKHKSKNSVSWLKKQ